MNSLRINSLEAAPAAKTIHRDGLKPDLTAIQAWATSRTLNTLIISHTDVA